MGGGELRSTLTARLVDQLYVEAMVLADEARSYFDGRGAPEREGLAPEARVTLACESLRVTTRLMHVLAWLLSRRAGRTGERLGVAADSDMQGVAGLPASARELIAASGDLYDRVARVDRELAEVAPQSPARTLLNRLEVASF